MDPATLSRCLVSAHSKGFNGGVMVWEVRFGRARSRFVFVTTPFSQYPDAMSSWIITVRGTTWPVFGAGHRLKHPKILSLLLLHFVYAIVLISS